MNREILFRGKRLDNSEWVEGYYVDANCINLPFDDPDTGRYFSFVEVDDNTIGQYTGWKFCDKKCFVGDIVKSDYGIAIVKFGIYKICDNIGEFMFETIGNFIEYENGETTTPQVNYMGYFEIIGNIHDNSELGGLTNETNS